MNIPGVSLCMIVKNESQHLEHCLRSVQGIVSEIIIADTGSTDNSMDTARRFGARILSVPWEHDFSRARNRTLELATCAWILVLDADEALAGWNPERVQNLLEPGSAEGYFLPFIHYVGEAAGREYVTDNVCRLFRNDERIRFRGSIHEEVASSIWSLPGGKIAYAGLPVHHYGYLDGELRRKDKASRNLELIHAALQLEPDSIPLRYALGTEYYQQGDYNAAAELLLPLLNEVPADSGYTADLYLKTAFALQEGGQPAEAESVYEAGSRLYPDFTDLLESYAGLLLEQGQAWQAYLLLQRALDSGNTSHKYPSSSGSGTSRTRLAAGRVCEQLFRYGEALEHYRQAAGYAPGEPAAWEQLATLCLLSGQEEELTHITRQLLPALPRRVLTRLVPAALNARAARWLAALLAAPQLPEEIRQLLQVLLRALFRDAEQPEAASAALARMQQEAPDDPWVSGYLWALSCRSGGIAEAGQGQGRLAALPPGPAAVRSRPAQQSADAPPSWAEQSRATQLLVQAGAWEALLQLGSHSDAARFRWSRLPLPLLQGLLDAPAPFKVQWCAMYTGQADHRPPADAAEWLLYAAIACSCGQVPLLTHAEEQALCQSGSAAATVGLSYHRLLLAAETHPQGGSPAVGSIPWLLLVKSALQSR
ncbi:glycosyltransferase [Paenibacillus sp. FSL K6-1096]|uniref:glycosyltransferase n=1 Tax=Paenibacillus sp. FSL K6-1096 TaxID=2921460 RepID=UPI0030EB2CD8